MKPSERLANFACGYRADSIPAEALTRVKAAIMDYTGVLLAGVDEDCARLVRQAIAPMGGDPQATVWGTDTKTSMMLAALANGTAAHVLDLDDTNPAMMSHPSVQLLPGLFALGEHRHSRGADLLDAYVVGFEVGSCLGRALYPELITEGWFPVGVLGTVMQTAACARLLRLNADQVRMAIGIAANLASGLRCNNGTMAKPLLAGQVGSNGILAAILAGDGITANPNALEAQFGFAANFGGADSERLTEALRGLGKDFEILSTGISHKLHACCAGGHIPIDCALEISNDPGFDPEEIESVEVSVHFGVQYVLIHPRPETDAEAKFSLEYAVARALLDGRMGPEQFTDSKVMDPRVRSLMERVVPSYYGDPNDDLIEAKGPFPVELRVRMHDGTMLTAGAEHARGTAANPLTWSDLESKFRSCVSGRLAPAAADALLVRLHEFEKLRDVTEIVAYLSPRASYHHGMEVGL
jgi:2-methylcitrate dehydratase PrpD